MGASSAVDTEELYDLVFDPNEGRNVAGDRRTRRVLAELRDRLEEWMAERDDPLLDGPVPPPPGAEINDPSQISPAEPTTALHSGSHGRAIQVRQSHSPGLG